MAKAKKKQPPNPDFKAVVHRRALGSTTNCNTAREPWYRLPEIGEQELKLAPIAYAQPDPVAWLASCNVYRDLLPDDAIERATAVLDAYQPPRPGPLKSISAVAPVSREALRKRRAAGAEMDA